MFVVREEGQEEELLDDDTHHLRQALWAYLHTREHWVCFSSSSASTNAGAGGKPQAPRTPQRARLCFVLFVLIPVLPNPINFFLNTPNVENILYFEECSGTKFEIRFMCAATLKLF